MIRTSATDATSRFRISIDTEGYLRPDSQVASVGQITNVNKNITLTIGTFGEAETSRLIPAFYYAERVLIVRAFIMDDGFLFIPQAAAWSDSCRSS